MAAATFFAGPSAAGLRSRCGVGGIGSLRVGAGLPEMSVGRPRCASNSGADVFREAPSGSSESSVRSATSKERRESRLSTPRTRPPLLLRLDQRTGHFSPARASSLNGSEYAQRTPGRRIRPFSNCQRHQPYGEETHMEPCKALLCAAIVLLASGCTIQMKPTTVVIADTPEAKACWRECEQITQTCLPKCRGGLLMAGAVSRCVKSCERSRDQCLMTCPGSTDSAAGSAK